MSNVYGQKKKQWVIAIVEDSLDYGDFLESAIFEVTPNSKVTCFDGGEALLEQIEKGFRPDIIFLDWNLPLLSGKEVLQKIKKSPSKLTTVFVITSSAMAEDIQEAYSKHCSLYFLKPSEPEELYLLLSELFRLIKNKFTLLFSEGEG